MRSWHSLLTLVISALILGLALPAFAAPGVPEPGPVVPRLGPGGVGSGCYRSDCGTSVSTRYGTQGLGSAGASVAQKGIPISTASPP